LWLDCFAHNVRAQRVYEKLGFSRDGVLRQAYRAPDGSRLDLTLMAITRPQWTARAEGK
jgi:RimJ/RimL family protein N-acetyltransferase